MIEMLLSVKRNILLLGETGSGKSLILNEFLERKRSRQSLTIMLCASSGSQDVQNGIENILENTSANTYGTVSGNPLYVFLTDMHVPEARMSGDSGPSLIMSEIIDKGGLYSTDRIGEFNVYENILLIGKLPTELLYQSASERLIGRSSIVTIFNQTEDENILLAQKIVERFANDLNLDFTIFKGLAAATVLAWRYASNKNPMSPSKPWFRWGLCDVLSILKNTMSICSSTEDLSPQRAILLWRYEAERVLVDKIKCEMQKQSLLKEIDFQMKSFHRFDTASFSPELYIIHGNTMTLSKESVIKARFELFAKHQIGLLLTVGKELMQSFRLFCLITTRFLLP